MRCTLLFLTALILPGLRPTDACAQFTWLQPDWQLTPQVTFSPTDAAATLTTGASNADNFSATFHTFANNPPGPGGGLATASLHFERSFLIDSPTPLDIPLRLALTGNVYSGFTGAFSSYSANVNVTTLGTVFSTGNSGTFALNYDQTQTTSLPGGTYNIVGDISTMCSATAGGPQAGADFVATFGLASTPIPEPGLLTVVAGLVLAAFHRRTLRISRPKGPLL